MTVSMLFGTGFAITAAFAFGVVVYLRLPLRDLLTELCGTRQRAEFWLAVSLVCMVLLTMIFAMSYTPEAGQASAPLIEVAAQLKWGMAGLLMAVVVIATLLSSFISRRLPVPPATSVNPGAERSA